MTITRRRSGSQAPDAAVATQDLASIDLGIEGMTCTSCARLIEKKLNKLDGVSATVNYATEKAKVTYDPAIPVEELLAAVRATGYRPVLPSPRRGEAAPAPDATVTVPPPVIVEGGTDPLDALRRRLLISLALTLPVVVLAMVPPAQFDYWQWASLTLAAPVTLWGAWPFHRAAWANALGASPPWTPSSASASSPRSAGPCTHSSWPAPERPG